MKKELYLFFTALQFFTRIPIPSWVPFDQEYLQKSRKYFPVIGLIVGFISICAYQGLRQFLNPEISIIFSMILSIWITGAFHEDGLADTFDAFGGGYTKEKILTIMKDSRIGTYGTVSLIIILGLKFKLLVSLQTIDTNYLLISIITAHTLSRFMASLLVDFLPYVQDIDKSKSKPIAITKFSSLPILFGGTIAILPFFLYQQIVLVVIIPIVLIFTGYLGHYFKKKIGGYTGDCLGATQQLTEVFIYLLLSIVWKFI
ncbi:adenosylcobinamide-GDP ribazoletransferase [Flammeovirga kamogawensis]|uniref:Adenosylcobinamide-GDP ribazoletransferase n=1 Tax=Flammeovirga kamogawensis TaxID=373891 RepID=A0ABX8GST5_9BACT|nr:adenosylcobinamide-GDP ribazoletransferase [Flammeovirga kamogawensis]MBB6463718.1 adenosylcobinamide-GDP ribazoletransferase [Flammeovirga kamogawensis]QWG06217.1 adenosylcobinamide-GDP ribazoletransferase [Flammeovirga kamogawensis]TRX68048.1 adenosylcobinamide-GDP ribazoletransferase [Flammeovirga kamogawensis]